MRLRSSLDSAAISVLVVLTGIFGLVVFLGGRASVRVAMNLPQSGEIGPFQKIKLTFSEPVDPTLAASLFSIQPAIEASFQWLDNRTLQLIPSEPFQSDMAYTLALRPGDLTSEGRALKSKMSWNFHVRVPLVVYLLTADKQSSLWAMDLNKNPAKRMTPENVKITSFDTSFDGEFIIFTAPNEQNGVDFWRVGRAGNDATILLDCGHDRCTTPTISPDGTRVAYSREAAGLGPDLPFGSPRIWILDLQSRQNSPVYADQQILGYDPSWSPDSTKLASYDGYAKEIRLLDLRNSQQYIFPSNTGGPITWSPDSMRLLYTDVEQKEDGLRTRVHLADLSLNNSSVLLGANDNFDNSYYSLAWSPIPDSVVAGFREGKDKPEEVFWLFDPSLLEGIIIADQPDYTYNSPRWDPWGTALIFQQFKLHSVFKPEIGLWKTGFNEPLILAQGIMPHWLP
jgi:dipeptidyl aminopeptidase/acylaminoacyl peptidase